MAIKVNIRKIVSVTLWCIVGAGVLVLLGASINYRNSKTCKGYKIDISGPSGELFIDRKDITEMLAPAGAGSGKWQDKAIPSFDLRRMESVLEKNVWIKDAQLFFDNNGILRINVLEREPVVRIFTEGGNSFYIDSSGAELPLSDRRTARLPVFTGYPAPKVRLHGEDSVLTVQIRQLGQYIQKDPFWMAQIDQVNITPSKTFELIPTVGNHLIEFGDGSDYEQKFHRLFVFYKEVLSRTGFDKYSRIDVEYAGQVVAVKKGSEGTRSDSLQGMKNIQQLIRSARQLQPDTARLQHTRPLEGNTGTEQSLTNYDLIPGGEDSSRARGAGSGSGAGGLGTKPGGVQGVKPGGVQGVKPGSGHGVTPGGVQGVKPGVGQAQPDTRKPKAQMPKKR